MESHEFVRSQGTRLLTSLPAAVRHSLRHYEVAAVIRPFEPRAPLHDANIARQFCYAAVTDWSMILLAMSAKGEASVLLEVPLLKIEDMDAESLEVADVVNDSRGIVRSSCISIYPKQSSSSRATQQSQQVLLQQQGDSASQPGRSCSPFDKLKQAFSRTSPSTSPKRFSINRDALVRPPSPEQVHQMDWQAAAAAVAPEFQRYLTVDQQQSMQQQRVTQNIIAQLQVPAQQWQQRLGQRPPGYRQLSAGPIAEAIEQYPSRPSDYQEPVAEETRSRLTAGQVTKGVSFHDWQTAPAEATAQAPASNAVETGASPAGIGVPVPSSKAPWSLMNRTGVSSQLRNKHDDSRPASSDSMQKLKQRFTVDNAVLAAPNSRATAEVAGGGTESVAAVDNSNSSSKARMSRLKQRLTVDTAVVPAGADRHLLHSSMNHATPHANSSVVQMPQDNAVPSALNTQPQQQLQHEQKPGQHHEQSTASFIDPSYCLQLITVERSSGLYFHIRQAWIGANMRAALAAAGAPGVPAWLPPPAAVFQMQQHQHHKRSSKQEQAQMLQQQQQPPGSPGGLRGLLRAATPQPNTPTAAAAAGISAMSMTVSDSISSGGSSLLSAETQAALQQDMMRFFGMNRDPTLARKLSGPFPGDTSIWQYQDSHKQPSASTQASPTLAKHAAAGKASLWEDDPLLDDRMHALQSEQQQGGTGLTTAPSEVPLSAFTPLGPAVSPSVSEWVADFSQLVARRSAARRQSCPAFLNQPNPQGTSPAVFADRQQQQQLKAKAAGYFPSQKQNKMLRAFMQVGAGVYAQPTISATRELFWHLADGLSKPCSLFDAGDVTLLKQLIMEAAFCRPEQVGSLQQAFFTSSNVMSFLLARITSWGVLMNLYPDGLPPIQNPAQPGRLEAYSGKPVVWTTALLYPGRPRRLMKRLGLTATSKVCFRQVLTTADGIATKHKQAASRAARTHNSTDNNMQQGGTSTSYYADPLKLSPLADMPYLFVANARRMMVRNSESSEYGPSQHLGETADDAEADDNNDNDLANSGTMAEATTVLRWERLVGRLASRLADRKLQLTLFWLQMQLSFTEGCSARRNWLCEKTLAQGPCPGSGQASTPWTFRAATQQLLASLLTLNLPGSRTSSKTLIPGGVDDLLWWAQQGTNSWVLDYVVGVVYELMGMCEQEESLQASKGASAAAAAGHIVMEVIREVPDSHLHQLLQAIFLRLICLMGGTAGNREYATVPVDVGAVLAYKYGSVLLEILSSVAGTADGLHDGFSVEVQHIMGVPQIQKQLVRVRDSCHVGVLSRNNIALLEEVLKVVGAAMPWNRQPSHSDRLSLCTLGHTFGVIKVQN